MATFSNFLAFGLGAQGLTFLAAFIAIACFFSGVHFKQQPDLYCYLSKIWRSDLSNASKIILCAHFGSLTMQYNASSNATQAFFRVFLCYCFFLTCFFCFFLSSLLSKSISLLIFMTWRSWLKPNLIAKILVFSSLHYIGWNQMNLFWQSGACTTGPARCINALKLGSIFHCITILTFGMSMPNPIASLAQRIWILKLGFLNFW